MHSYLVCVLFSTFSLQELLIEDCALRTLGDLAIVCNAISKSADQNKVHEGFYVTNCETMNSSL